MARFVVQARTECPRAKLLMLLSFVAVLAFFPLASAQSQIPVSSQLVAVTDRKVTTVAIDDECCYVRIFFLHLASNWLY